MKKRLLSIIAILALCLALLSVTALATDTVDYGVTVNKVEVTSANASDVLGNGQVSYDADSKTLTINGTLSGSGSGGPTIIGNGTTNVVINSDSNPAVVGSSFTVTGARDVTVTANFNGSAIFCSTNISCSGNVNITNSKGGAVSGMLTVNGAQNVTVTANSGMSGIGGGADINCSGNVKIINNSNNPAATAVSGSLTVNHAQDVTVTANGSQAVSPDLTIYDAQNVTVTANSNYGAIAKNASITCSGDVKIENSGSGSAVGGTLTVKGAKDVTVTANSGGPAIAISFNAGFGANIACSGDVNIANNGSGTAVDGSLTVKDAQNVTVTANSGSPAINGATEISCSGDVEITNSGSGSAMSGSGSSFKVTAANNVTLSAAGSSATITTGSVEISCSGDVSITNSGSGSAMSGNSFKVTAANNVTLSAAGSSPTITTGSVEISCSGNVSITNNGEGSAMSGSSFTVTAANDVTLRAKGHGTALSTNSPVITCSGNVEIASTSGPAVAGRLTVNGPAQNVTVTANINGFPAISGHTAITCSGNVEITNNGSHLAHAVSGALTVNGAQNVTVTAMGGQAVSNMLTVKDAQNVTVTANINNYGAINYVDITCSGDVKIVNEGDGKAVGYTLTFQQSNGHSYTVKTGSLESLDVYAEKEAGKTFGPESFEATVSAVKIESADHTLGEWEYNSTQHWHSCTVCEAELDRENHTFSGNTCTVCGYSKPVYVPTYPPIVEQPEGGTLTVSPKYPIQGSKVTITATPDEGYEVDDVTVTDRNGNPVEVTDNGNGTYTFKQPYGRVTISGSFKPIKDPVKDCLKDGTCPASKFTDVKMDWTHDGIHFCVENGLMNGTSDTTFEPDSNLSRAMLMTILARLDGVDTTGGETWYEKGMAWAVANGISDGTNGDANITREQIVTMLYRYAVYKGYDVSVGEDTNILSFADAEEISSWAKDAMQWAVGAGLINGKGENNLDPTGKATRAEMAAILYRFCENVAE